jgi:hypothetical protein
MQTTQNQRLRDLAHSDISHVLDSERPMSRLALSDAIDSVDRSAPMPTARAVEIVRGHVKNGRLNIAALDPDSTHPAWSLHVAGETTTHGGGSSARGRILPSLRGFCELLEGGDLAGVAVEHPGHWAPGVTPASMEGVYRTRYYAEAACELLGLVCVCVTPSVWQSHYLRGELTGRREKGDAKRAYRAKSARLWPGLAGNEDRAASLGILSWLASEVGIDLHAPGC